MNNLFDLTGKVAVVTGGTKGIGAAIAKGLKDAGAKVWIHGSQEVFTRQEAEQHGYAYSYGDLSTKEGYQKLVDDIRAIETKVDILINNAGMEYYKSIEEGDHDYLDSIYQVNCKSPYFLVQALLPLLRKSSSGSIINVTSIHDVVPVRRNSSYCMSKASLAMYTKVAALELAKEGIRVNNLAPGAIATSMNEDLIEQMDFDRWIPLQRPGTCDEMIGPSIFLASEASSYMTGATLYVDGGYKENLLRY